MGLLLGQIELCVPEGKTIKLFSIEDQVSFYKERRFFPPTCEGERIENAILIPKIDCLASFYGVSDPFGKKGNKKLIRKVCCLIAAVYSDSRFMSLSGVEMAILPDAEYLEKVLDKHAYWMTMPITFQEESRIRVKIISRLPMAQMLFLFLACPELRHNDFIIYSGDCICFRSDREELSLSCGKLTERQMVFDFAI